MRLSLSMASTVSILSDEAALAESLKTFFDEMGCEVYIHSRASDIQSTDYLIVVNIKGSYDNDNKLLKKIEDGATKTVIVNGVWGNGIETVSPVKQIFVDQLIPSYAMLLSQLVSDAKNQKVFIPKNAWISISRMEDLVRKVGEELFSFPESKKILFGKLVSFRELVLLLSPSANILINANERERIPRKDLQIVEVPFDLRSLSEIPLQPVSTHKEKKVGVSVKLPKIKKVKVNRKVFASAFAAILLVLVFPYIMLFAGAGSSFVAYNYFKGGNIHLSRKLFSVSNSLSGLSSTLLASMHILPFEREANLLTQGTEAIGRVLSVSDYSSEITEESLRMLHLELSALYRDLSFIDGEVRRDSLIFAKHFPEIDKLSEYREYVLAASKITANLPSILGFDRPKTYLVLFQNNMELRPTGGFIGSFALVTVSKGEILDDTIYDVYSADGQLKGYIEPPSPIVEHLGEASWTLRDSNWDPNFPTSAQRAEWFLDKSIDRKVDGVIGINLETAKEYLKVVEPVHLLNFNTTIDSKNMYEKVQHEVEDNFFPGSRKKAQYLSALSEALIARIETATVEEYIGLLAASVSKLNSRDIQIYLHDESTQKFFVEEEWAGEMPDGMFSGFVEANLGVNKANYYVSREANVVLTLEDGYLEQEVSLKLRNSATSRDNIPADRYKAYIRALAPSDSEFHGASVLSSAGRDTVNVDIEREEGRVEYGTLIEVLPGEEKVLTFRIRNSANIAFGEAGNFSYTWWKQSGTGEYPFNISVKAPSLSGMRWSPPFSLTNGGMFGYNSNLVGDFKLNLEWTNQ